MQKLIIVCGLPGTGKTTLAKELSRQLKIACLHKDSIKEGLYEILGLSTLEDSKRVGLHSIKLLYKLTEEQLANKVDLIIEAPFYFEGDYELFIGWQKKFDLRIYSIICRIDETERVKRIRNRKRHKGHHDTERTNEGLVSNEVYKKLPGRIIEANTSTPTKELAKELKLLLK